MNDELKDYATVGAECILTMPQYSGWRVWIMPGTCFSVTVDRKIPNRFQRWMQECLLGWRWEYEEPRQ